MLKPDSGSRMTTRDFCYWLQGYFELNGVSEYGLSKEQVEMIQKHLYVVFKHECETVIIPQLQHGSFEPIKPQDFKHQSANESVLCWPVGPQASC